MGRAKSLSFSSDGDNDISMRRVETRDSSDDGESDIRKRSRNRINLACGRCRIRKIRCDGQSPCSKCVTSSTECEYLPVTREENILAREKKALSKANRVRAPKLSLPKLTIPAAIPKTKRKGTSRKQSLIESIIIASPLRAESHDEQLDGDALAAAEAAATTFSRDIAASSHMDSQYSRQGGGDISGMSTPAAYFDYSSSTSSLPSERDHGHSGYSPALTYTSPQYYKDEVDYDFRYGPRATLDFQSYPVHHARHSHYIDYHDDDDVLRTPDYVQSIDSDQPRVAYPASVAADGPSGLCMYLPAPSTPYAMAQTMSRSSPSYNTGIHYSPAYDWSHSPKIYQGPIDWSARPLVPFSHPPSIPQTVRMDEICRVPL